MTIETLQNEMIVAMKQGNKFEKNVISGLIAQIKKAAIDAGCRDNITEEFVNRKFFKPRSKRRKVLMALLLLIGKILLRNILVSMKLFVLMRPN